MKQAVLFDMDGVILDSMPFHVKAWKDALSEFGLTVTEELLYLHEGAIEPKTAVQIFSSNGCLMNESLFHSILKKQMDFFTSRYKSKIQPFPKVYDLLSDLRKHGYRLALVTSSHSDILDEVLPSEIKRQMDHIVTGNQVIRRKPYPDPYLAAVDALEVSPNGCVVVENAPAGITSAKAANLKCIALTTTLSESHLAEADDILRSHEELYSFLLGKQWHKE